MIDMTLQEFLDLSSVPLVTLWFLILTSHAPAAIGAREMSNPLDEMPAAVPARLDAASEMDIKRHYDQIHAVAVYDITAPRKNTWALFNKHGTLVEINLDTSEIKFGPNYTPDEAARIFWEAIGGEWRCSECGARAYPL